MSLEIRSNVVSATSNVVKVRRNSKEFDITVTIDFSKQPAAVRSSSKFVNSILSELSGMNISVETNDIENPLIIENIGNALGEAFGKAHDKRKAEKFISYIQNDNDMMGMVAMSRKKGSGEANLQIIGEASFDPEHFFTFFDGFAQGFSSDLNIVANFGKRKNGQLEFISRTFCKTLEKIFHKEYDVYGAIESFN